MDKENDTLASEERVPNGQSLLTEGIVISLHIAPAAQVPMTALSAAHLVPGRGIVGDRYYLRRGRDAAADRFSCDVTLESTEQAARCLVLPRSDLRADVLTDGIISVGDRIERISESETSR